MKLSLRNDLDIQHLGALEARASELSEKVEAATVRVGRWVYTQNGQRTRGPFLREIELHTSAAFTSDEHDAMILGIGAHRPADHPTDFSPRRPMVARDPDGNGWSWDGSEWTRR